MDEKVLQYRKKYKKCNYCKHLKYKGHFGIGISYYLCEAKDKIIGDYLPDKRNIPRLFYSCYEVDEQN